jgi:WD40 repeat protein
MFAAAVCAAPAQATFPGRNGEILFTQSHESWGGSDGKLIALDPDTHLTRTLWECMSSPYTPVPECDAITSPAVSPDGRTVAVISLRDRLVEPTTYDWSLNLVDMAGAPARPRPLPAGLSFITDERGRVLRWMGDGTSLSASLWTDQFELPFVHRRLGLDGALGAKVGPDDALAFDWSVDGRAAFILRSNLFVLSPDGGRRRLTLRGAANPSWSPHGRWIAFDRGRQIWVVDSRGGRPRRLTSLGGRKPGWSPDGRRIAFVRRARLYVLSPSGGPARQVSDENVGSYGYGSSGSTIVSPPEWQPLPR